MNFNRVYIFIGLLTVPSVSAFAYVDPGTGSMALQFMIGGLFAAALTLKTYYYKIRSTLAKLFGRKAETSNPDAFADKEEDASQSLS
jgi:hypothetical protein